MLFGLLVLVTGFRAAADPFSIRHYTISFQATSGTFAGQTYTGSFDLDQSGVTGIGTETLPNSTVQNFQLNMFGSQVGPLSGVFSPVFSNGVLTKVVGGLSVPSATEGNQLRSVGINSGFGTNQVPPELVNGDWWGYLTPQTFVDGFGPYTLELQPLVPSAYQISFQATSGTFNGQSYQGSFNVDASGVTGVGTETLPSSTVTGFRLNMFGSQIGPVSAPFSPVFSNGVLGEVVGVISVPSATEGNQLRSVGINAGFGTGQVPPELVNGDWWGYLTPQTFVDGFGPYEVDPTPVYRHYNITFHATSGTFNGQTYTGTFDVNVASLRGIGTETLPSSTLTNVLLNIFGGPVGPLAGIAAPVFVNGQLVELEGVFSVPSASDGNQLRSIGMNAGFGTGQVPPELVNGAWWGYLTPQTFVDGFGPYVIEEAFDLQIFTAVELVFATRADRTYQIQSTSSLGPPPLTWTNVGTPITGTGAPISQLVSTRGSSAKFFRVQESGQ